MDGFQIVEPAMGVVESVDSSRIAELVAVGHDYDRGSRAGRTWRGYQSDWRHFTAWCERHDLASLPATPTTVALYLAALAPDFKVSTLRRRLAAISVVHQGYGHVSPTQTAEVKTRMSGIARAKAGDRVSRKEAAWAKDVRMMVTDLGDGARDVQIRAALTIGFAGGFRRSELVALDIPYVTETDDGLVIRIRKSKTDQEGVGRTIGIPYGSHPVSCPVRAYRAWRKVNDGDSGPLFRSIVGRSNLGGRLSDRNVARTVQAGAKRVGLNPERFGGHSLRAGFVTSAADGGASEQAIMAQTGHRSSDQVRTYMRDARLFHNNAAAVTGL